MATQTITSANTSINKNKLPMVYTWAAKRGMFNGAKVLDYGCGKFDNAKEFSESLGASWRGYDKYNRSEEYNNETLSMYGETYTEEYYNNLGIVICSNVLNVINSDEEITRVVNDLEEYTGSVCLVTVYEGDKSGIGRRTQEDCYQRNMKTSEYVDILRQAFDFVRVKGKVIICSYDESLVDEVYNLKQL